VSANSPLTAGVRKEPETKDKPEGHV